MIFVDSSVWIEYFNGRTGRETDLLDSLLGRRPLLVGDVVLTEVLQGFRRDRDFRIARKLLCELEVVNVLNTELALRSAEHFRFLRKRGITVRRTIDTLIATFCIHEDLPLLHSVRDFDPFERHLGLRVL